VEFPSPDIPTFDNPHQFLPPFFGSATRGVGLF
jgi:hypothetical protein